MDLSKHEKNMTVPKVIIIILNWNGKADTIECLESLKHITYPNYEILLVDNGSSDGSVECFKELYPGMEIIENGKNLGFAEGNNVGMKYAIENGADYLMLLNNDVTVHLKFLDELMEVAKNDEKNWIVGPKILYFNNPEMIASAGGEINFFGKAYQIGNYKIDNNQYDIQKIVTWLIGAAILIKKDLFLKIGGFNPDFFIFEEDLDICLRVNEHNFHCVYAPNAKIFHKGEMSTSKIKDFHSVRNGLIVAKNHYNKLKFSLFLIRHFFFIFPRSFLYNFIKGRFNNCYKLTKATLDGLNYRL